MSWRVAITHRTGYRYRNEVTSSYNEARITPISNYRQLVMESTVVVDPPASVYRYWDYWGTLVHAFDVQVPHRELAVTGTSVIETSAALPAPAESATWADLHRPELRDRFAEVLAPTSYVAVDDVVRSTAEAFRSNGTPREAFEEVIEWVRGSLRYEKGTTDVSTPAAEVLAQGSGVCQDFAHVTLALLRALGIPGRYVSGYLHPEAEAEVGSARTGESHAWVEAWTGEWQALDPTNGHVAERHVMVGRARDYADLSPLRGIYHGGPAESLGVTVELNRLS